MRPGEVLTSGKKVHRVQTWKKGMWLRNLQKKGGRALCLMQNELSCKECPFITCNNHPQFYMALQCALRMYEAQKKTAARAD